MSQCILESLNKTRGFSDKIQILCCIWSSASHQSSKLILIRLVIPNPFSFRRQKVRHTFFSKPQFVNFVFSPSFSSKSKIFTYSGIFQFFLKCLLSTSFFQILFPKFKINSKHRYHFHHFKRVNFSISRIFLFILIRKKIEAIVIIHSKE